MQAPLKLVLAILLTCTAAFANAAEPHSPANTRLPFAEISAQAQPAGNQAMTEQIQKLHAARNQMAIAKKPAGQ
ncbi:hypothetical protein D3C76_764740 [compost metagenome]